MPSPRISLDQWRALLAVVDEGGYAKAAQALHKSQSSVTYAVQQIESLLGVKVFKIDGRKAALTPAGDALYRRARYLLDEAASLERSSKLVSAGWEPQIAIAVEGFFPSWLLLHCLEKFGRESPHTRIEVYETILGHRTDMLSTGSADLAIFSLPPQGFEAEPLGRMRFLLVASPKHPLHALGRKVTMRDLRKHRHLVIRESSAGRGNPVTVEATERWTVSNFAMAIQAARAGYGFVWLPEEKIRDELASGALQPIPLRDGGERFAELYLVHADRDHAGPGTQRLAQILREDVSGACAKHGGAAKTETLAPA